MYPPINNLEPGITSLMVANPPPLVFDLLSLAIISLLDRLLTKSDIHPH
jgi:hypothetical protein